MFYQTRIVSGGLAAVLLLMSASLQGCGGGGAHTTTTVDATTTGQELTDLKKALDEGVITQREYNKKREEILKRK
jgi:hypothetical protein